MIGSSQLIPPRTRSRHRFRVLAEEVAQLSTRTYVDARATFDSIRRVEMFDLLSRTKRKREIYERPRFATLFRSGRRSTDI